MIDDLDVYSDISSPSRQIDEKNRDKTNSAGGMRSIRKRSSVSHAVETLAGYVTGGMNTVVGLISSAAGTSSPAAVTDRSINSANTAIDEQKSHEEP